MWLRSSAYYVVYSFCHEWLAVAFTFVGLSVNLPCVWVDKWLFIKKFRQENFQKFGATSQYSVHPDIWHSQQDSYMYLVKVFNRHTVHALELVLGACV